MKQKEEKVVIHERKPEDYKFLPRKHATSHEAGGSDPININALTENLPLTRAFTAGEDLVAGNVGYLKPSDGLIWKTIATDEDRVSSMIVFTISSVNEGNSGSFLLYGEWETTGLTANSIYRISDTEGEMSDSIPASGSFSKIIGHSIGTTILFFNPSTTWVEVP